MIQNHGIVIPEKIETREEGADHILGSSTLPGPIINPKGDWTPFLPLKESQNRGFETFACASFATNEALEVLEHAKYGVQSNHSDRALAVASGTDPYRGNDPHVVAEYARKHFGAAPEALLPFGGANTEEYHNPGLITPAIKTEAKKFITSYDIGHKWVFDLNTDVAIKHELLYNALKLGTVCVSVVAWRYDDEQGCYVKDKGEKDTHWTLLTKFDGDYPIVSDSYSVGEKYEKRLSRDYDFNVAKVFYLTSAAERLSILSRILSLMAKILGLQMQMVKQSSGFVVPPPTILNLDLPPEPPTTESIPDMVLRVCREEGLPKDLTEKLYKTISCESKFDPKAVNRNVNGTTDLGIIQANSYWYVGPGKPIPSADVALNNPEFCVRVMARMFKVGRAKDWICYRMLFEKAIK